MRFPSRRADLLLVAAVVGLAAGGAAYASIPGPDGVIHACYQRQSGQLRVIDSANGKCLTSENPLTWNQTGPTGAPGAKGPTGLTGARGPSGPAGPTGMPILRYVTTCCVEVPPNLQVGATTTCPNAAPYVVGGGVYTTARQPGQVEVNSSSPDGTGSWLAYVDNLSTTTTYYFDVYAICTNSLNVG